jgi:DNA-binding GntR family transcriptional regulator
MTLMNATELDRSKSQKLYSQLLDVLIEQLCKGCWSVGTQIPTEEQLCIQYNVSKATVRLALAELVSQGYLKRIQGKGTFVRRTKADNRITMLIRLEDSDLYENPTIIRVIEQKTCKPSPEITGYLHLEEDDHCFFLSRLIIAEGSPFCIQKIHVPYSLLAGDIPAEEIRTVSPYCYLESFCGTKINRIKEMCDVAPVAGEDAAFLEIVSGTPVLRQRQICFSSGDVPMTFVQSHYKTEVHTKTAEFERLRT